MAKASQVAAPESWTSPRKLKRPGEWMIGMLRAANSDPPDIRPRYPAGAQNLLGEPLWRPRRPPTALPTRTKPGSMAMAQRLDIATQAARQIGGQIDPKAALDVTLGPLALGGDPPDHQSRGCRPQAVGAPVHGARIPAQVRP